LAGIEETGVRYQGRAYYPARADFIPQSRFSCTGVIQHSAGNQDLNLPFLAAVGGKTALYITSITVEITGTFAIGGSLYRGILKDSTRELVSYDMTVPGIRQQDFSPNPIQVQGQLHLYIPAQDQNFTYTITGFIENY
jgi:hypothetical protein